MLNKKILTADLCVVGGGMAGLCAAIEGARNGSRVVLMHERPVLGGNASSEIRMWICGARGENNRETGILEEIALENLYRNPTKNYYIWDTVLLDFARREKNLTLLLNCTCMDADTEAGIFPDGRTRKIHSITGYQMTTQTFYEVRASYYADCSGDSILAPLSGAEFRMGRESSSEFGEDTHVTVSDNLTMGNSCLIQGRETTRPIKFTPPEWSTKLTKEDFQHRNPDPYKESENCWYLELGGTRNTIEDSESIAEELVPLALGTWDYLKNSGNPRMENWELDFLGFLPGKRESRRMMGEYLITERDVSGNTPFEDTVAYGGWPIDDHYPGGFYHKGRPNTNALPPSPYNIPYRALYSKNVENLFFAGRNISMTHMAMSSIRVMATCALMGQAVGAAAALAAKNGLTPHGVYRERLEELQETLTEHDCFLPTKTRKIHALCNTPVNGCKELHDGRDRPNIAVYGTNGCGVCITNGMTLEYRFAQPVRATSCHVTFDSDLNRTTLPGGSCERGHSMRSNVYLDSPQFHLPKTLCKEFCLEIRYEDGTEETVCEKNNRSRYLIQSLRKPFTTLRLTVLSNWGETDRTNVFSFDFK